MRRVVWLGLLIAASMVACNKNGSPPASSTADTAAPAATATPAPAAATATPAPAPYRDGSPLLVDSADGVHIEYRLYGKGEPAVVLVHGWSCNENYWNAQIDALKAQYTVVLIDLAGHGASGRNRADWSMANYGEDVAAVVRQIPNAQVVLVGHSMGATV